MAKIKGSSITDFLKSDTKLISSTNNPIGTIFCAWHGSRNNKSLDPVDIQTLYDTGNCSNSDLIDYLKSVYAEYDKEDNCKSIIESVVLLAIRTNTQVSEFVSLEFETNNATVAWRDQLVRNRRLHAWVQSSRPTDLTTFDSSLPISIKYLSNDKSVSKYKEIIDNIRKSYVDLINLGVPSEDIRLFPQSMTHRCYWGGNLREILKLVSKRLSWIAQATYWSEVISDIIKELRSYLSCNIVDSLLGSIDGVEYSDGCITNYSYTLDNTDRFNGVEKAPCDPLWLSYEKLYMPDNTDIEYYDYMKSLFINLWNDEVLSILKWDRNDPSKIGPYDRPYNTVVRLFSKDYLDKLNLKRGITK